MGRQDTNPSSDLARDTSMELKGLGKVVLAQHDPHIVGVVTGSGGLASSPATLKVGRTYI